jgi:hypothetical protein
VTDARTYIRVHDGMPDHPKVESLSDRAFRLLIQTWCWCSRHLTDGVIPRQIWERRGTPKTRNELVTAGLVSIANDRIVMHDYLEHQRSADQVAEIRSAKRRASSLGNHNRWHKARGILDPTCQHCMETRPPPSQAGSHNGSHVGSQVRSHNDRKRSPETETETEITAGLDEGGGSVGRREDSQAPPFNLNRCLEHQLGDDPGPCGGCRDARLRQEELGRLARRSALTADRAERDSRIQARIEAITACNLCDDNGYRGRAICGHDPAAELRVATGVAAVRAALTKEAS